MEKERVGADPGDASSLVPRLASVISGGLYVDLLLSLAECLEARGCDASLPEFMRMMLPHRGHHKTRSRRHKFKVDLASPGDAIDYLLSECHEQAHVGLYFVEEVQRGISVGGSELHVIFFSCENGAVDGVVSSGILSAIGGYFADTASFDFARPSHSVGGLYVRGKHSPTTAAPSGSWLKSILTEAVRLSDTFPRDLPGLTVSLSGIKYLQHDWATRSSTVSFLHSEVAVEDGNGTLWYAGSGVVTTSPSPKSVRVRLTRVVDLLLKVENLTGTALSSEPLARAAETCSSISYFRVKASVTELPAGGVTPEVVKYLAHMEHIVSGWEHLEGVPSFGWRRPPAWAGMDAASKVLAYEIASGGNFFGERPGCFCEASFQVFGGERPSVLHLGPAKVK